MFNGAPNAGTLEIVRSTISGNTAIPSGSPYTLYDDAAGGVLGVATIDNSTITGKTVVANQMQSSTGLGVAAGGVALTGALFGSTTMSSIDHSTIAFNKVVGKPTGNLQISGGVVCQHQTFLYNYPIDAIVTVHDTIIAKNQSSAGEPDVAGAFQSLGHNLIGVLDSGASGFVASDLHGTPSAPLDPRLLPLGWYGGPTETLALAPDSPAINAGDNTDAPPTDQRGDPRIVGGTIDIGAYEYGGGSVCGSPWNASTCPLDDAALLDAVFADYANLLNWQGW